MDTLKGLINSFTDLIGNTIGGLLLTIAVAVFFYSIIRFLTQRARGDAEGMKDASNRLGWSIVALFVMFSIWGIIAFLQGNFGFTETNITAPSISLRGGGCSYVVDPVSGDTIENCEIGEEDPCTQYLSKALCENNGCTWHEADHVYPTSECLS